MEKTITDSEIIKEVMAKLGISNISFFANKLGYKNAASISAIINGHQGKKLSEKLIGRILATYPQVSEEFLRFGKEPVLQATSIKPQLNELENIEKYIEALETPTTEELRSLLFLLLKKQTETNDKIIRLINKLDNKI
ncbi:hypothetical protein [Tenacibaculum sp. 190524A02b]|uniref:hypothetical protein n=1 Tax=Tenacibaculum vairaonense TaxID=3137860 RepID=UPI0031FAA2A2